MIVKTCNASYALGDGHVTRYDAAHELPGDGQALTLLHRGTVEKGRSMMLEIVLPSGETTFRHTSPVMEIAE